MSVFTWTPSYSSSVDTEIKLRKAQFGDGYSQRSAVGINNLDDKWNLQFSNIPLADMQAIRDFFRSHASGVSFDWSPYEGSPAIKAICPKWKIVASGYNVYDITCQFERVYGE